MIVKIALEANEDSKWLGVLLGDSQEKALEETLEE
jgi:hypothetical protein